MTKPKDRMLKPPTPAPPRLLPRCTATLTSESAMWRKRGNSSSGPYNTEPFDQCTNQSAYRIDGKYLCRRHAGLYVLDKIFPPTK